MLSIMKGKALKYRARAQQPLRVLVIQVKSEMIQLVADAWKALSDQERAYWDEEARNDKLR
jgi:hypothetical protein